MAEKTNLELTAKSVPEAILQQLACRYFGTDSIQLQLLKGDGSDRKIYRISADACQGPPVIGVFHTNRKENRDYLFITAKMKEAGIRVPETLLVDASEYAYLQQYLGEKTLAQQIDYWRIHADDGVVIAAYETVISNLIKIQRDLTPLLSSFLQERVMGAKDFLADLAYCEHDFIQRFDLGDLLNKAVKREWKEQLLTILVDQPATVFVYRDFQSRNFMWLNDQPWFIDFQSAFLGARYYDLASMLFASRSGLDDTAREHLLAVYYKQAGLDDPYQEYLSRVYSFVLLRRLRSLGSYGYLSGEKGKAGFQKSIGPTLSELTTLLSEKSVLRAFPNTLKMMRKMADRWYQTL